MDGFSAATTVLELPELLSMIFEDLYAAYHHSSQSPPFIRRGNGLLASLLVNSTWFHEASRIFWQDCGGFKYGPNMFDLAGIEESRLGDSSEISGIDLKRRQKYANHAKTLHMDGDLFGSSKSPCFLVLTRLGYPCLEALFLGRLSSEFRISCHSSKPQPLLASNLRSITFEDRWCGNGKVLGLSIEEFFSAVGNQCKQLRKLRLSYEHGPQFPKASPESFIGLLRNLPLLEDIAFGTNLMCSVMSSAALQEISRHKSLAQLELSELKDEWIADVEIHLEHDSFLHIETLSATISDSGLKILLPHLRRLRNLHLTGFNSSTVFRMVSTFRLSHLEAFSVTMKRERNGAGGVLDPKDLETFAASVPNLKFFACPAVSNSNQDADFASSELINDTTIECMASSLPNLDFFKLDLDRRKLTYKSILSLCKHCPNMDFCSIRASVDFAALLDEVGGRGGGVGEWVWTARGSTGEDDELVWEGIKGPSWPKLTYLDFGWRARDGFAPDIKYEDVQGIAADTVALFPNLKGYGFYLNRELSEAIDNLLEEREHAKHKEIARRNGWGSDDESSDYSSSMSSIPPESVAFPGYLADNGESVGSPGDHQRLDSSVGRGKTIVLLCV